MKYSQNFRLLILVVGLSFAPLVKSLNAQNLSARNSSELSQSVLSLNGEWLIEKDPKNVGKSMNWWKSPSIEAKKIKVPWILQDVYPGYHGVVWYWDDFIAPKNTTSAGRTLLRLGVLKSFKYPIVTSP